MRCDADVIHCFIKKLYQIRKICFRTWGEVGCEAPHLVLKRQNEFLPDKLKRVKRGFVGLQGGIETEALLFHHHTTRFIIGPGSFFSTQKHLCTNDKN